MKEAVVVQGPQAVEGKGATCRTSSGRAGGQALDGD